MSRHGNQWLISVLFSILVAVVYSGSFVLPAVDFGPHRRGDVFELSGTSSGFEAFFLAIPAILSGLPVWLANPVFWLGLILLAAYRPLGAAICGAIAVLLALTGLQPVESQEILLVGYYVWLTSIGLLFLAGVGVTCLKRVNRQLPPEDGGA